MNENSKNYLNKYYIEAKYPPDMPIDYPKEEAKEAITKTELIFITIKSKLVQKQEMK